MNYSTTYLAVIVAALAELLKWLGLEIGNAELTTTVLTAVQIFGALWVLVERFKKGGISTLGFKK